VVLAEEGGEVTESGFAFFEKLGGDLRAAQNHRRVFCRPCLDWTERRPHIGGSVGAVLTERCFDLGWVTRIREGRALTITEAGRRGFNDVFGVVF
jgi:hypothetical protein